MFGKETRFVGELAVVPKPSRQILMSSCWVFDLKCVGIVMQDDASGMNQGPLQTGGCSLPWILSRSARFGVHSVEKSKASWLSRPCGWGAG